MVRLRQGSVEVLFALVLGAPTVAAELPPPDLALAPGDVIEVSVFADEEVSRSYRLREDGSVSTQLLGPIPAAGLEVAELEALFERRLGEVTGATAFVTVEASERRPVAVLGDVAAPGLYPFSLGLDVARALALAGGLPRVDAAGSPAPAMRVAEEERRFRALKGQIAALLAERARLEAERDGALEIVLPGEAADLAGPELAAELVAAQARLMAARRALLEIQTEGAQDREKLARLEAKSFAERRALIQRQLSATLEDLADQERLREKGLATSARLLELSVSADQYRSDDLEAAAFEAAALQSASNAASSARALQGDRAGEISARLAAIGATLAEARAELEGTRGFLARFGDVSALIGGGTRLDYVVTRRIDGAAQRFAAGPDAPLQPGDTLEAVLVEAGSAEAGLGEAGLAAAAGAGTQ